MRNHDLRLAALWCTLLLVAEPVAQSQFRELVRTVLPPATSGADCLAVADLDGDGDLDLLLGQASGQVRLYVNLAPGSFRDDTGRMPSLGGAVQGLAVGDLDRDGSLDVAVATSAGAAVLMARGGPFRDESASRLPPQAHDSRALILLDVDGDGDLDLFVANLGQDRLYTNDGNGTFTDVTATSLPADADDSRSAVAVDLDRDGNRDLVVGNNGGDRVLRNAGGGRFVDFTSRLNAMPRETHAVVAGDHDRDLDVDVFAGTAGGWFIYWNTGGTWAESQVTAFPTRALALGDVDNDGWLDVMAGGITGGAALYLNQRGAAGWYHPSFVGGVPQAPEELFATAFADLDADGDPDLVMATRAGTRIYFGDGAGDYLVPPDRVLPELILESVALATGDYDQDGDLDLLLLGRNNTRGAPLLRNDGADGFVRAGNPVSDDLNAAVFADVDNDGFPDIVGANDLRERLYLNNGGTGFVERTEQNLPPASDVTRAVAAGDVDGDGDVDLVFGNDGQSKLYINTGRGVFFDGTPGRLPIHADLATAVVLVDLDGDLDLDLVVANHGRSNRVLLNDGAGVFSDVPPSRFSSPVALTQAVAAGDVDGDGDVDLWFANWGPDRLYRNDGGGAFTDVSLRSLPALVEASNAVSLADVDLDGDLDAVVGVLGQNRMLRNDGPGVFTDATAARMPIGGSATRDLRLIDVDHDGDLDLVEVSFPGIARLYSNLARQTRAVGFALPGGSYRLEVFAEPWSAATRLVVPMLATARSTPPLPTPFGELGLDPGSLVLLPSLSTMGGSANLPIAIPANRSLSGAALFWQSLVLLGPNPTSWRLTNVVGERIG